MEEEIKEMLEICVEQLEKLENCKFIKNDEDLQGIVLATKGHINQQLNKDVLSLSELKTAKAIFVEMLSRNAKEKLPRTAIIRAEVIYSLIEAIIFKHYLNTHDNKFNFKEFAKFVCFYNNCCKVKL
jgi:hypothetical protein